MELSVVIPLYNTEKYIEKCVLSVVNQDIDADRYEILVVNDGSTDGGSQIVARLAELYPNITLMSKPNQGLGDTRNHGLERARGDYILFLDSDDYFAPNVFSHIIKHIDANRPDMLVFDYTAVDSSGSKIDLYYDLCKRRTATTITTGKEFLLGDPSIPMVPMVALYCFNRQFLNRNSLKFMKIIHEDEEFTPRAIALCSSIQYIPLTLYYYLKREGSITMAYDFNNLLFLADVSKSMKDFAQTVVCDDKELHDYFMKKSANWIINTIDRSIKEKLGIERRFIKYAKQKGALPVDNRAKSSRIFLLNHLSFLYIKRCKR